MKNACGSSIRQPLHVQEVAVVERLQSEKLKRQIALRLQRRGEPVQVETAQIRIEQLGLDAGRDIGRKVFAVARAISACEAFVGAPCTNDSTSVRSCVEQQARADIGVSGLLLDQRARRHHRGQRQFVLADAVVDVAMDFGDDGRGIDAIEPGARLADDQREPGGVERSLLAAGERHMQDGFIRRSLGGRLPGTLPASLLAIKDIGARDLVVLAAHQGQFDLVLNVFDMEGASLAHPPCQRADDHRRSTVPTALVYPAGGGGGMALDRKERLGHRDRNLAGVEPGNRAVAADHLHSEARLPAQRAILSRSRITGVALASRSSESDIGRPRGRCAGAGYLWGRCIECTAQTPA